MGRTKLSAIFSVPLQLGSRFENWLIGYYVYPEKWKDMQPFYISPSQGSPLTFEKPFDWWVSMWIGGERYSKDTYTHDVFPSRFIGNQVKTVNEGGGKRWWRVSSLPGQPGFLVQILPHFQEKKYCYHIRRKYSKIGFIKNSNLFLLPKLDVMGGEVTFPSKDRKRATLLTTDPTSLTKIVEEEEDFLGVLISHRKWAGGVGYGDQVWALRSRTAKSQKAHKQVSTMIIFFISFFFIVLPSVDTVSISKKNGLNW